jgi:DNA-binding LytR/AlgR family response regulator
VKVLLVDDEPVARQRLERLLVQIDAAHEIAHAGSAREALAAIGCDPPDVVLLDIEMPGVDGLTLAALGTLPPIVFVTAHSDRALAAFDVGAVDYLVKPVSRERLVVALERLRPRVALSAEPWRLIIADGTLRRFVDAREVSCFHADAKYVRFTHQGREHLLRESLDALEERLAGDGFVRAHRAALVRCAAVTAFDQAGGGTLVLSTGESVPVSRRCLPAVRAALGRSFERRTPRRGALGKRGGRLGHDLEAPPNKTSESPRHSRLAMPRAHRGQPRA